MQRLHLKILKSCNSCAPCMVEVSATGGGASEGPTCASRVVPEVWGVMAWFFMLRHGWSFGAGCWSHTSPA